MGIESPKEVLRRSVGYRTVTNDPGPVWRVGSIELDRHADRQQTGAEPPERPGHGPRGASSISARDVGLSSIAFRCHNRELPNPQRLGPRFDSLALGITVTVLSDDRKRCAAKGRLASHLLYENRHFIPPSRPDQRFCPFECKWAGTRTGLTTDDDPVNA